LLGAAVFIGPTSAWLNGRGVPLPSILWSGSPQPLARQRPHCLRVPRSPASAAILMKRSPQAESVYAATREPTQRRMPLSLDEILELESALMEVFRTIRRLRERIRRCLGRRACGTTPEARQRWREPEMMIGKCRALIGQRSTVTSLAQFCPAGSAVRRMIGYLSRLSRSVRLPFPLPFAVCPSKQTP